MRKLISGLAASLMCVGVSMAQMDKEEKDVAALSIGDKAPRLEHVDWLQGGPVSTYESGHVYVLDFWATWCGPCVAAIPHMNELYREHTKDDVHVVGLAIWPNEKMTPTAKFVAEKGGDMAYTIGSDINGKCAEAFMEAAGQNGIPTVMIVNQQGRLAWIGHPMSGMDEALEKILAGEYDIEAAAADHKRRTENQRKAQRFIAQYREGMRAQNWAQAISAIDKLLELDAEQYGTMAVSKYVILVKEMEQPEAGSRYGREMVKGSCWDNADMLNAFAWQIVDPEGEFAEDEQDLELAMLAAKRGNELEKGENAFILDTLARVYFRMGEVEKAIDLQEEAVERAEGPMKEELAKVLKEYKESLATF